MSRQESVRILGSYYDAFNRADFSGMLNLLSEDIAHDINQGKREIGKEVFARFLKMMDFHYKESVRNLVVTVNDDGSRAGAEFIIDGTYKQTAEGLPPANNQSYSVPVGAFFEIKNGKIARVTNYYNLQEWIAQVSV